MYIKYLHLTRLESLLYNRSGATQEHEQNESTHRLFSWTVNSNDIDKRLGWGLLCVCCVYFSCIHKHRFAENMKSVKRWHTLLYQFVQQHRTKCALTPPCVAFDFDLHLQSIWKSSTLTLKSPRGWDIVSVCPSYSESRLMKSKLWSLRENTFFTFIYPSILHFDIDRWL